MFENFTKTVHLPTIYPPYTNRRSCIKWRVSISHRKSAMFLLLTT